MHFILTPRTGHSIVPRYHNCQSLLCNTITNATHLDLETSGCTTTTSLLEFTALGLNVRFLQSMSVKVPSICSQKIPYLVLVWSHAEVLDGLTSVLWSSEEKRVASRWGSQGQLIQSQGLSSGGKDARTSGSGEAESSHAELGDGQETVVIGDGANDDDGLVVRLLGGVRDKAGDGDGRSVDAGHE